MAGKIQAFTSPAQGVKKFKEIIVRDLVAVSDAATMSREENVAGLASAIVLANEARTDIINHFNNATRHTAGVQDTTTMPAAATDLASLLTLATALLALYEAHNADTVLATPLLHHATDGASALADATAPTTLQLAVTRLNDLKGKYNTHEIQTTSHDSVGTVAADAVAAADAAYGTANLVPVTGCETGCRVFWSLLNVGAATTGVSAVAGNGGVTFTFANDPENNTIISYMVARPAA